MRITGFIFLFVSAFFFCLPIVLLRHSKPSIMIIGFDFVYFIFLWPLALIFGIAGLYFLLAKNDKLGTTGPRSYRFACQACGAQGFTETKDRCPSCAASLD